MDVHLYPVSSRISGYLIKVDAEDNQYVRKGTVLVEIDPRDYGPGSRHCYAITILRGPGDAGSLPL